MTKSKAAFLFASQTLGKQRLYLWTFTFRELLAVRETRKRWNYLLTLLLRTWPELQGLRVFELHQEHGLHVHLVTNQFIDVNRARELAMKAGWGRIHVTPMPSEHAGYLAKYLSKERPGMPVPVAALGGLRERLGVDEGQRCDSRDIAESHLSGLQRVEGMDGPEGVFRTDGFGAANCDVNYRAWLVDWVRARRCAVQQVR